MIDFTAARTNMVDSQLRTNKVTSAQIVGAFEAIPREVFLPENLRGVAYIDEDLSLGQGRHVMEPMVLARLIQEAHPAAADMVLEIGSATGYGTAVLAQLAETVVGIDSNETLVGSANETLNEMGIDNAVVVTGDMTKGYAKQGPYNVILFAGAVGQVPDAILDQLADGGRLVAVVLDEDGLGRATLMQRGGAGVSSRRLFDAATPVLPGFERPDGFVF